jgi:hypothetical protein
MSETNHVQQFIEALRNPGTELRTYLHAVGSVWDETTWDDASKAAILDALVTSREQYARVADAEWRKLKA